MSSAIREHLRSNIVGYIAIFMFAIGGTAFAIDGPLPGQNQVGSQDIINGEVQQPDIGLQAVGTDQIKNNEVRSPDIKNGEVTTDDVLDETLTGADVLNNSIDGTDITNETLTTNDLQSNSVQFDEIEDETIRKADIGPAAVGASEVGDGVVTRTGTAVTVPGGAAQNGAYDVGTATAACNAGEELIGGNGFWTPDDNSSGNLELWIAEVRMNTTAESVIVDGGNDSGADHDITAYAVCLTV